MGKESLRSNKPIVNRSKSKKYDDRKLNRQRLKHKEKKEKLTNINNIPRTSRLVVGDKKYFTLIDRKVRIGGKGTMRIKKKKQRSEIYVKNLDKVKPKPIKPPIKYPKDECVVCFERIKMEPDNTIDCHNVTHPLCRDCKKQMKKDMCPLCNSHSIGIEPITNYIYSTGLIRYRELVPVYYDRINWIIGGTTLR